MRKSVVSLLDGHASELTGHQAFKADQKMLALWAADCAERVLPYFEKEYPKDRRPRRAIETLREWAATGVFKMAVIRKASLDAHAAAREAEGGSAAQAAARAAGQAVATAHVPTHSMGAPAYALKAIAAADPSNAVTNMTKERNWQLQRLRRYAHSSS